MTNLPLEETGGALLDTEDLLREGRLREREERLRLAEQAAAAGIWEIDIANDTVRGSPQFFRIMGLEPTDDAVPMTVLRNLRPPDDRERVNQGYTDTVAAGLDYYESEYRILRGDGEERWILGRGKVIRDPGGQPLRYSGVDMDVTERKRAELALKESEARLNLAVVAGNIGIWDWNVATGAMTYSDEARAIYGFAPEQPVTYELVRDATDPRDLPRTSSMAQQALDPAVRAREPYEYRIIRPGGELRWIYARGEATFAVVDGVEKAIRYTGTIQDITQRKKAENRIRKSEQRLRLAIEAGRLAIWEYDLATDKVTGTAELNRILGFQEDQPLDVGEVRSRYYPGDEAKVKAASAAALAAGERYFQVEFRFRRPDEAIVWFQLRAEILIGEDGPPSGAIGVLLDITERRKVEEHRQFLASELQHRTKNLLSVVKAIASQTFRDTGESGALQTFAARLAALGSAHDLLHGEQQRWAELRDVLEASLRPHGLEQGRFEIRGPSVLLSPRQGLSMSLALNELATNAAKHGALGTASGRVHVVWERQVSAAGEERLNFVWRETDGPPVRPPQRTGFGTRVIRDQLAADFRGSASLDFAADGVIYSLNAPWPKRP